MNIREELRKLGLVTVADITTDTDMFEYHVPTESASTRTILAFCPGYKIGFVLRNEKSATSEHDGGLAKRDYWDIQLTVVFARPFEMVLNGTVVSDCDLMEKSTAEGWTRGWSCAESLGTHQTVITWNLEKFYDSSEEGTVQEVALIMETMMPFVANGRLPRMFAHLVAPYYTFPKCVEHFVNALDTKNIEKYVREFDTTIPTW